MKTNRKFLIFWLLLLAGLGGVVVWWFLRPGGTDTFSDANPALPSGTTPNPSPHNASPATGSPPTGSNLAPPTTPAPPPASPTPGTTPAPDLMIPPTSPDSQTLTGFDPGDLTLFL